MKIKLLVAQSNGIFPDLKVRYDVAETLEEARKIDKDCIDRNTFSLIKALERNTKFVSIIGKIRNKFNIPKNGYSIEEWHNVREKSKSDQSFSKWRSQVEVESIKELTKAVSVHPMMVTSLPNMVLLNCVFVPLTRIFLEVPYSLLPRYSHSATKIVISSKVSKNQLLKFIEDHWREIENELNRTDGVEPYISERDYKIIELKDNQSLTFNKIADILTNEIDTAEGIINEDSVKTAYHRAKKQINSLTKGNTNLR
jgi:hypothetical protein